MTTICRQQTFHNSHKIKAGNFKIGRSVMASSAIHKAAGLTASWLCLVDLLFHLSTIPLKNVPLAVRGSCWQDHSVWQQVIWQLCELYCYSIIHKAAGLPATIKNGFQRPFLRLAAIPSLCNIFQWNGGIVMGQTQGTTGNCETSSFVNGTVTVIFTKLLASRFPDVP